MLSHRKVIAFTKKGCEIIEFRTLFSYALIKYYPRP